MYSSQYQPYQSQFQQYQPTLPSIAQPMLTGHLVASQEDIKPNDVPMNGSAAYFPSQDGQVIYAKAWNQNGTITTVEYVPRQGQEVQQAPTLFDIANQLSNIEDLLSAIPAS